MTFFHCFNKSTDFDDCSSLQFIREYFVNNYSISKEFKVRTLKNYIFNFKISRNTRIVRCELIIFFTVC